MALLVGDGWNMSPRLIPIVDELSNMPRVHVHVISSAAVNAAELPTAQFAQAFAARRCCFESCNDVGVMGTVKRLGLHSCMLFWHRLHSCMSFWHRLHSCMQRSMMRYNLSLKSGLCQTTDCCSIRRCSNHLPQTSSTASASLPCSRGCHGACERSVSSNWSRCPCTRLRWPTHTGRMLLRRIGAS